MRLFSRFINIVCVNYLVSNEVLPARLLKDPLSVRQERRGLLLQELVRLLLLVLGEEDVDRA